MTAFDPASIFVDARPEMSTPPYLPSIGPAHAPFLDATNTTAAPPLTVAVPLPGLKPTRIIKRVPVPPLALPTSSPSHPAPTRTPARPHADDAPPFRITSFPRIPPARASSASGGPHERRFPPADPHALVRLATDNLARIRYERELDALWRSAGLERAHAYASASIVEDDLADYAEDADDDDDKEEEEEGEDEVEFSITPLPRTLPPCRPRLSPDPADPYSHARRFPTLDAHALRRMAIENFAMQRDWELERWGADADAVGAVYEDEDAYEDAYEGAYGGADGGDAYYARDAPPHMPVRAATPNNRAPPPASASSCSSSSCYDTDSSASPSASPSLSASEYDSNCDHDSAARSPPSSASCAFSSSPQKPLPTSPSQSRIAVRGYAAALFGRLLGTGARKGGACAAPEHVPAKSPRRMSVCAQNGVGRSGSAGGDGVGSGRQQDRDRDRARSWIAAGFASVRNMWTLGV